MLFALGIIVGVGLSLIMIIVSIELEKRRLSPITAIKQVLPKSDKEKGELIKPEDEDLERFIDTLIKDEEI